MQGEFSVLRGYGGDVSNLFAVTEAGKAKGSGHTVYTVIVSLLMRKTVGLYRAKTKRVALKFTVDTKNSTC